MQEGCFPRKKQLRWGGQQAVISPPQPHVPVTVTLAQVLLSFSNTKTSFGSTKMSA